MKGKTPLTPRLLSTRRLIFCLVGRGPWPGVVGLVGDALKDRHRVARALQPPDDAGLVIPPEMVEVVIVAVVRDVSALFGQAEGAGVAGLVRPSMVVSPEAALERGWSGQTGRCGGVFLTVAAGGVPAAASLAASALASLVDSWPQGGLGRATGVVGADSGGAGDRSGRAEGWWGSIDHSTGGGRRTLCDRDSAFSFGLEGLSPGWALLT